MGPNFDWFDFVQKTGASSSVFLLGALYWLNSERSRLLKELEKRDEKLESLAERFLVMMTEVRAFLLSSGKNG